MEEFNTVVNKNLDWIHKDTYVFPIVTLFLSLYVALARPKLPNFMVKLFENILVRFAIISYIIYKGNNDPKLSIMIAGVFLVTMHLINRQRIEKMSETMQTKPSSQSMCGR